MGGGVRLQIGECCACGVAPFGLVVIPRGCGCGCGTDAYGNSIQTGLPHGLCAATITIKSGATVVATCTSTAPPCTPCKFPGLANGTYTIVVEHANYTTSTTTYTYTSSTVADVWYYVTLCEETGKHCLGLCGDPGPVTGPLTLTIHEDLVAYKDVFGVPLDGPVELSWQASPLAGGLGGPAFWGQTTASVTVGVPIEYCVADCPGPSCNCYDFTTESATFWLRLECATDPRFWRLYIYGPLTALCLSPGPYDVCVFEAFFLGTSPVQFGADPFLACLTEAIPGGAPESPHHACDPLELDFLQSVDGVTWTVWGTITA
jgi:hypothetical protein